MFLSALLLSAAFHLNGFGAAAQSGEGLYQVVTATTDAYPGDRTEIWAQCNAQGELEAVILEEYNLTEPRRKTHRFTLEQVNSAEGVVLKSEFTVVLLVLKGRGKGLGPLGGPVDLEFRKSNWFSDRGRTPLFLRRDRDTWRAYSPDSNEKPVNGLRIHTWTGFGFGIEGIEAK